MTAEIGIVNRNGAVLAADSMATIRVFSTEKFILCEKVFNLSINHAVGIMIYGSAQFADTSWETIIKIYKTYIQIEPFNTLHEYGESFRSFLVYDRKIYNYTHEQELLEYVLEQCLMRVIPTLYEDKLTLSAKAQQIVNEYSEKQFLEGFDNNFIELFKREHSEYLINYINEINNIKFDDKTKDNLILLCGYLISKSNCLLDFKQYTGIVICGYGKLDVFPSIIEYQIIGIVSGKLIYKLKNEVKIGIEENSVSEKILSFAQRDVIDMYMTGIDPSINEKLHERINNVFNNLYNKINSKLYEVLKNKFTIEEVKKINSVGLELKEEIVKDLESIKKEKYLNQFSAMIGLMRQEDLAILAQALVEMTSIRRRFTMDLETVGGPIDVAIITKVNGFKWVKKKQLY